MRYKLKHGRYLLPNNLDNPFVLRGESVAITRVKREDAHEFIFRDQWRA